MTEIPYQVNKAKLIERIAELVRDKKIEGISDLRDESDREGMRIVIELKKDEPAQVVLNNLYKMTPMQSSFGIILLAIVHNQPHILTLREALSVLHRAPQGRCPAQDASLICARRKPAPTSSKGSGARLIMLDAVIPLIRASKEPAVAQEGLMTQFQFSEVQAQAILEMRLQRLTGLEREKIIAEYEEILKLIARLKEILASEKVLEGVIVEELRDVQNTYGDERRTRDRGRGSGNHARRPDRRRRCGHYGHALRLHQAHSGVALPDRRGGAARGASG